MSASLNGPPRPRSGVLEIQTYLAGISAVVGVDESYKLTEGGEESHLGVIEALHAFVEGWDRG